MHDDHQPGRWRLPGTRHRPVLAGLLWAIVTAAVVHTGVANAARMPTQGLVARYLFNGNALDSSGFRHNGVTHNVTLTSNRFGKGSSAYSFNGTDAYIEIPDNSAFSPATTGQLPISVWMRPGTLTFPRTEGTGCVHWLGKGQTNQQEWAFRMYTADNTENRANRTSFYLCNLADGEGAGSFVQQPVAAETWYHYVAVADMHTDTIKLYKNGVLEDQDPFMSSQYHIHPLNGTAPVRVGTRDFASFFKGTIDNLSMYNRALSATEVQQIYLDTTQ